MSRWLERRRPRDQGADLHAELVDVVELDADCPRCASAISGAAFASLHRAVFWAHCVGCSDLVELRDADAVFTGTPDEAAA
jgi:hypothetical protein